MKPDDIPTLQSLSACILPILAHYGATRAGVFGSLARGQLSKDSDIDILVQLGKDLSLLDVVRINRELEEAVGRRIDLVEYDDIKPRIRDRILEEEIRIL